MTAPKDVRTIALDDVPALESADAAGTGRRIDDWASIDPGRTERLTRALITPLLDHGFRLRTYGADRMPATGGVLICPNHASWVDPFVQARGQRRLIRFMAKEELFSVPIMGRIMRSGGAFPIRRNAGDSFALGLARHLLEDGEPVMVYAEGTRHRRTDDLGSPRSGAARLALGTGVPVLPVAAYGTKPRSTRSLRKLGPLARPRITTVFGWPLIFTGLERERDAVDTARTIIWSEVARLYAVARELDSQRARPRHFEVPPPSGEAARWLASPMTTAPVN